MGINTPDDFPFDFIKEENIITIRFHVGPVIKVLKKEKKLSFSKDNKLFKIYEDNDKNRCTIIDEIEKINIFWSAAIALFFTRV